MSNAQKPFLKTVASATAELPYNLKNVCVVFPSRRAEIFFKKYLAETTDKPLMAPALKTAEELVTEISGLSPLKGASLIFEAYEAYEGLDISGYDSLEDFLKWATTALHDFNEIDRHMVDAHHLFDTMVSAKTLERWGATTDDSFKLIDRFLEIWKTFKPLYLALSKKCQEKKWGWQGMAYRMVAENLDLLEGYMQKHKIDHFVFAGFNALNRCEERIIEHLLLNKKCHIYWDSDAYYLQDKLQESGQFIRERLQKWSHYEGSVNFLSHGMLQEKNITIHSSSGSVEQAKKVGEILNANFTSDEKTAVVLADENLLMPVLNSVPNGFDEVNVTMGLNLRLANPGVFALTCLKIKGKLLLKPLLYIRDLERLLDFESLSHAFKLENSSTVLKFIRQLKEENRVFLSHSSLRDFCGENGFQMGFMDLFFKEQSVVDFTNNLIGFMEVFVKDSKLSNIEKEIYYSITTSLKDLITVLGKVNVEVDYNIAYDLIKTALSGEQVSFYGEPLKGLQVMGILETRTLDFENIILSTVNEGVLPSGKSNNSYIPYDIRRYYQMPVHNERDAIYAYHFYRLLQRAKQIHIVYNNTSGGIGGKEKSRFVRQIETEWKQKGVTIHEENSSIVIKEDSLHSYAQVYKSRSLKDDLKAMLVKGISPTALSEYVRNPLNFYFSKVLGIRENEDLEETIGHATLGSVVHDVLEDLYKPFVGSYPKPEDFKLFRKSVNQLLNEKFELHYKSGQLEEGKNLLVFQVAQTMIQNFLGVDEKNAEESQSSKEEFKILSLEEILEKKLFVPALGFEVRFFGKADRIEQRGNEIHIIDYKTGAVESKDLVISELEDVFNADLKKEKVLQLLMYAYMFDRNSVNKEVYASVLSLRKWKQGALRSKIVENKKPVDLIFNAEMETEFEKLLLLKICEIEGLKTHFQDINVNSLELAETQS